MRTCLLCGNIPRKCYCSSHINKQGQVQFYAFMVGLLVLVLALALAPAVVQFTSTAMSNTTADSIGMDCTNTTISNFQKVSCYTVDMYGFLFIGSLIMIGGIFLIARIIFAG